MTETRGEIKAPFLLFTYVCNSMTAQLRRGYVTTTSPAIPVRSMYVLIITPVPLKKKWVYSLIGTGKSQLGIDSRRWGKPERSVLPYHP